MVEKIVWTQKALCDLRDIFDYIHKDSEHYATLVTEQILNKAVFIKDFPFSGRIVPEFNQDNLREVIFKSYRLIYKVQDKAVYVLRVYHSSRSLSSI